jgi:hypothetical protein
MLVHCPACGGRHAFRTKEGKLGEWDGEKAIWRGMNGARIMRLLGPNVR